MQAVITVPAYFDEMRRKATADAGEMAGLRVLDIVNEPTAAALAFGEALGYLSPGHPPAGRDARQELNVLVYDLGGGTFDVTLLRLAAGKVQTLATDGDVQLGGHDWDQQLVDYAADCFQKTHQIDPRQDPATLNRLYLDAMEAKHTLSARGRAVVQINYQGRFAEIVVSREQFEEMTANLLERTSYTTRQLLGVAGLEWKDLQRVLLVGGSTRMPMVARMLQGLSGIQPDRSVNPDEAVARGAALYAGHLLAARSGPAGSTFQVTNVNAHSLGVEGIDTETLRRKNVVLIPRNTPLPARHTERFATKSEGQRSIAIKVLEGEGSQPDDCIAIGRTVVRDLPLGLPKGWPVEVTFEYGANGRLAVEALVPGTHHQARLELVRETGLSNEGLTRWKQPVSEAGGFRAFESAAEDVLHAAPPLAEAAPSGIGSAIGWAAAAKTEAGGAAVAIPPLPPLAASPAETAAPQRWASGPQPLTGFSPLPPGDDQASLGARGVRAADPQSMAVSTSAKPQASKPLATAAAADAALAAATSEEPLLPLIKRPRPAKKRRIPKWVQRLIGHSIALLLFGLVGYLMISRFRPDLFPTVFSGRQNEQKQNDARP